VSWFQYGTIRLEKTACLTDTQMLNWYYPVFNAGEQQNAAQLAEVRPRQSEAKQKVNLRAGDSEAAGKTGRKVVRVVKQNMQHSHDNESSCGRGVW
jgi:hypothetical protein